MPVWLAVFLGVAACALGVLTFYTGRQTAAKTDGASFAILQTDISYIKTSINEIKSDLKDAAEHHSDSIQKVYARIERHEQVYHGQGAVK